YALGSAAHLFRDRGDEGEAGQVRVGPAIGSNPATFLVDHPVHEMSIYEFFHYSLFPGLFVAFTYNKKQPPAFGAAPAFWCILLSFLGLSFCHIPNNLSNYNVLTANAPFFYQISGTWSNHEGSILLWCRIPNFYGFFLCYRGRPQSHNNSILSLPRYEQESGLKNQLYTPFVLRTLVDSELRILPGSWWAYHELGRGGWWFRDPVENASFMPRVLATARIHSVILPLLHSWTSFLNIVTFPCCVSGTFSIRSGLLAPVHSFATDDTRGIFLWWFFLLMTGISMILFYQMKQQASVRRTYKKEMVVARSTLVHLRHSARAQPRPSQQLAAGFRPAMRQIASGGLTVAWLNVEQSAPTAFDQ
ncbi:unnamed protein product, partial [Thlaspi arvense]